MLKQATYRIAQNIRYHGVVPTAQYLRYRMEHRRDKRRWEYWLWEHVPAQGYMAIDAGANQGQWSRQLAERFSYVVAFEPNPSAFNTLRQSVPSNVTPLKIALWRDLPDHESMLPLVTYDDTSLCRMAHHDFLDTIGDGNGFLEVPTVAMDRYRFSPDFIKLDVEGAEVEVIRGAWETLETYHPTLLIEIHSGCNLLALEDMLPTLGYSLRKVHYPFYRKSDPDYERRVWLVATVGERNMSMEGEPDISTAHR